MSRNPATVAVAFLLSAPFAFAQSDSGGAVYTQTNAVAGNQVAIFTRAADGSVTFDEFFATGGLGTGTVLGSQGAVVLSQDEQFLFVVNAGSNSISVLRVLEGTLELVDVAPSKGQQPVSVTQHDNLLYVVNAGNDRIAGFRIQDDGTLDELEGSKKDLGNTGSGAAQIGFSPDGRFLYVTERFTDQIVRFNVKSNGKPSNPKFTPSEGIGPFGFAFGFRDQLFVSEGADGLAGASTVTSFEVQANGQLQTLTDALATTQTAACWITATPDRRLIYVSNTGSDTVSLFDVAFDGTLTLTAADAAGVVDAPLDSAVTPDGRFFYVLASGNGEIADFDIAVGGALTPIAGTNSGLPASSTGLAAR